MTTRPSLRNRGGVKRRKKSQKDKIASENPKCPHKKHLIYYREVARGPYSGSNVHKMADYVTILFHPGYFSRPWKSQKSIICLGDHEIRRHFIFIIFFFRFRGGLAAYDIRKRKRPVAVCFPAGNFK